MVAAIIASTSDVPFFTSCAQTFADPPAGYYNSADPSSGAALRASVHAIIDDHTRIPYTSGGTDTWNVLELADEDPNNAARILDVYKNSSYAKAGGGNSFYDREHTWPNSYGFPDDGGQNYPYTDCHHLMLCTIAYNGNRGNKPFATCSSGCSEQVTDVNNGQGGGSGVYPGQSNWTSGSGYTGSWETWIGKRGDVARAMFYMDVRYEGGTHGITSAPEPNLILTDNRSLIASGSTGSNVSVAYMGLLSTLLTWHASDPVDDRERGRNDDVYSFQGNRNPFVDHPEWVECVFSLNCADGAPAAPTGLSAVAGDVSVALNWNDNSEADLAGYFVYRSTTTGGTYSPLHGTLLVASQFMDSAVVNGTNYFYVVTAEDSVGGESVYSAEVSATPNGGGPAPSGIPWINEIHYDNIATDANEGVEIAAPAGTNLGGWSLLGYNGSGAVQYQTINLSGVVPNQQDGIGALWFAFLGLQNGAPDGLALVNPTNNVVQFLSYEGSFTATDGTAAGMVSTDIGVSELGSEPLGQSLQLQGQGCSYSDFAWSAPSSHSQGLVNAGQNILCAVPAPALSRSALLLAALAIIILGARIHMRNRRCKAKFGEIAEDRWR